MKRGSVIFDESGFLSQDMLKVYSDFAIVDKTFKTGKDDSGHSIDPIRQRTFPTNIPNQRIFISSASDVSTPFYKLYRDFAKKQIMGDPDFCVMHVDCTLCFTPTLHGEMAAPLLTKSQVEADMRQNKEKSLREYYCIFTTDGGSNSIIKRGSITRNEETRKPQFRNPDQKKYIIVYDPARLRDNSVLLVGELYNSDGRKDLKVRIVNCVNLIDVNKKTRTPMQTPEQVQYLRELILEYNGVDAGDGYPNIVGIWIDQGSGGGGGTSIADMLMQDWVDKAGIRHRGFIDKEYSAEYVGKFPDAVDKLHIMTPSKYKSIMYESLIEMINQDKIKFTASYDNKGYLTIFDVDKKVFAEKKKELEKELKNVELTPEQFDEELQDRLREVKAVNTKIVKLQEEDELALANIDAMKEQLVNMVRKKRDSGNDSFELVAEKANKMHDDRAYCAALLGYALVTERRKLLMNNNKSGGHKSLLDRLSSRSRRGAG